MVTKAATSTLGGSRDRGATGSRGSADPPLFRVRGPHAAFDHQFLSTIPTSTQFSLPSVAFGCRSPSSSEIQLCNTQYQQIVCQKARHCAVLCCTECWFV